MGKQGIHRGSKGEPLKRYETHLQRQACRCPADFDSPEQPAHLVLVSATFMSATTAEWSRKRTQK